MAKGNSIILSANPQGKFLEGTIAGTPKPGTMMQIKAATEPIGGRHTWEAYAPTTDGDPRLCVILLEDHLQGRLATDAYVAGTRGFLYAPIPGEEMNVLLADVGGTGDTHAIGDRLIGDTGTGKLVAQTNSANHADFVVMETLAAPTADTLVWAMKQ